MADEMIAMQLCGAHVGRTVSFEYVKTATIYPGISSKKNLSAPFKITKLIHWRNGDVSISQSWEAPRYPYDARVIFHD